MMDDVCFSGSALALFTALLGGVVGALSLVFRMLMEAKDRQVDMALEIARSGTATAQLGAQAAGQALDIARHGGRR